MTRVIAHRLSSDKFQTQTGETTVGSARIVSHMSVMLLSNSFHMGAR